MDIVTYGAMVIIFVLGAVAGFFWSRYGDK